MTEPSIPLTLPLESTQATLEHVGGKGASLARLLRAGLPVPPGFHITTHAYRRFVAENHLADAIISAASKIRADDPASLERASSEIQTLITRGAIPADIAAAITAAYDALAAALPQPGEAAGGGPPVAVRSSATAEDLPELSFAGQQETYLNVAGAGASGASPLHEAVKKCWASLWTARALSYRARQGIRPDEVALAVVVQALVPADAAGILFTANPVTGARGQAVINAAWGLGEAVVGGHVTPDTFVVDRSTGAIESQDVADKAVMTVRQPGGTREDLVPAAKRSLPALRPEQAAALMRIGVQIEQLYGQPMDVEWAIQDGHIFILQARPITALPEPPAPLEWDVLRPGGQYARSSVVELLPDPLSPLFATLALPLWNDAMHVLMTQIGLGGVLSPQMLVTINDYAYYDFGLSASQSMRMVLALPGLMRHGGPLLEQAQTRWAEQARPHYARLVSEWAARDLGAAPAALLLQGVREIVRVAAGHYLAIQTGILPVSYLSEAVFTRLYDKVFKRRGDPPALTFMLGFDSLPIQAEKSLYDLAMWARSQGDLAGYLTRTPGAEIARAFQSRTDPAAGLEGWPEFCRRFAEHLERFGHAVYDLDFAKGLAADEPAPLLETLKYFLGGQAASPYVRQSAAASAREQATGALLARLKGPHQRWFAQTVKWAQRYAPLREDALADVGLGWPLLRRMLCEIGRRLKAAGAILGDEDVFWLNAEELESATHALDAARPVPGYGPAVVERRATWERERRVTPPVALPIKGGGRFLGFDFTGLMPAHTGQAAGNIIKGQGASPGRVAGAARVLHGPGEFDQMRQGDILVAKITTPAWTPLFALASGIVTDVGGPLSHSSIVAREYGIPAVLGTGVATGRIRSGQRVSVDGDSGTVTLEAMPGQ